MATSASFLYVPNINLNLKNHIISVSGAKLSRHPRSIRINQYNYMFFCTKRTSLNIFMNLLCTLSIIFAEDKLHSAI